MTPVKLILVIGILLSVWSAGCKKENETLTVEVADYITSQPIQGAIVKRSNTSNFSLSCMCYQVNAVDSLGSTDNNGQLKGLLSLEDLVVEKSGYYTAHEFYYCIHEKTEYLLKFSLFKQASIRITSTPSRSYQPDPYIEVGPVLHNGSMKSLTNDGDRMPGIPGYVSNRPAAGDMQNRVLILKRNDGSSRIDTLYKTELFVPANTTKNLSVIY
jgi:hypothetical protein